MAEMKESASYIMIKIIIIRETTVMTQISSKSHGIIFFLPPVYSIIRQVPISNLREIRCK